MTKTFLLLVLLALSLTLGCSEKGMNPTSSDINTTNIAGTSPGGSPSASPSPEPSQGQGEDHHVTADLVPVNGSGVTGHVTVEALPHGGVNISLKAFGLDPGTEYVSLYYENHTCELEPYEEDDVIGEYTGNTAGVGQTQNKLEDDLDEVNSISVRLASDFSLLACADIHP